MATIEIVFTVGLLFFLVIIFGMILGRRKTVTKPKSSLYTQALNHIFQGEYEPAIKELKAIINKDTSHIDAYIKLGNLLRVTG
ncbi:MAG: hypothetical protein KAT54_02265, partial [Candidatus Marinimicrobia bacterium]|nr:hypothetical protein [Candidatus Neomarinimicrobiota bacterium]